MAFIVTHRPLQVQVHVAHTTPSTLRDHGLGIFDISDSASVWALTLFLLSIREGLATCARVAKDHAVATLRSLLAPEHERWRVDLAREALSAEDACDHTTVAQWVEQCRYVSI